jgi:hypothetical protein
MRQTQEIIQEIADRLGILSSLYRILNHAYRLKGDHALKPGQVYPSADVVDQAARAWFGEEHGRGWVQEYGVIRHPRDVEAYIGPYIKARMPIYLEHF